MATKDDGGSAFPRPPILSEGGADSYWSQHPDPGMSLRDWFAGQALSDIIGALRESDVLKGPQSLYATRAYEIADAMLIARKDA